MDGLERALLYQNELYHALDKDYRDKLKTKRYNAKYYEEHKNAWKTKYYHYKKKGRRGSGKVLASGSNKTIKTTVAGVPYNPDDPFYARTLEQTTDNKHTSLLNKVFESGYAKVAYDVLDTIGDIALSNFRNIINPFSNAKILDKDVQKLVNDGKKIQEHIEAEKRAAEIEERKKHERYDEKTGFYLKTYDQDLEKDILDVNAKYKNLDTGSKNNCMLCSVATELRKRGYDATANQADYGYTNGDLLQWFPEAQPESVDVTNYKTYLLSQGEGASGVIGLYTTTGGHAVHYRIKDGNVIISDGQTGEIYTNPNFEARSSQIKYATIVRLDNQEPDWKAIKEACT